MKKNLLFTIALFSITLCAQAQISKGSVLLGGGISAGHTKIQSNWVSSTTKGITLSPVTGFVIRENLVVGVGFQYAHTKSDQSLNSQQSKSNLFGGNIFVRKYLSLGKKFYLFGEGGIFYTDQNFNASYTLTNKTNHESTTIGVSLYPGITYAVSKRFHLEVSMNNLLSLSYTKTETKNESSGTISANSTKGVSFQTNASSTSPLTVGFRVVLGK